MEELKNLCDYYELPNKGKKGAIIERIKHFLQTGEILSTKKLPQISLAQKGKDYPLKSSTLIVKGAYKNDLATRKFFQKLIGEYFHFTAFGQDWISDRWQRGKPPTYGEFAKYWEQESEKRKNSLAKPKEEWAYISFLQKFQKEHSNGSKQQAMTAWEKVRAEKVAKVKSLLMTR